MKKQLIAKLVVLCLALAMLPTAAFAAAMVPYHGTLYEGANGVYGKVGGKNVNLFYRDGAYYYNNDTNSSIGTSTGSSSTGTGSTDTSTDTSVDVEVPDVIDTVEEIKADQVEVTEEGTTVTLKATVENGVASVAVTEAAVESLAEQVKGSTLTIVVEAEDATKVAVSLPGKALAALAEKTGADLVVESPVATITIPNAAMVSQLKDVTTVAVMAEANEGVYVIAVMADGKAINENIDGLTVKF